MLWMESAEAEERIGLVAALHKGLSDLGYIDGQTIRVEERFAGGNPQRIDELAAELVRLKVDLIVSGAQGTSAAARATKDIPIVSATTADPVAEGLAASLAHPGGNVTGSAVFFPQMMAKRLELLKQIAPTLKRAGVLSPSRDPLTRFTFAAMSETAKGLGVELELVEAADVAAYETVFASASAKGVGGFVILDPPIYFRDASVLATPASSRRSRSNIGCLRAARRSMRAAGVCPDTRSFSQSCFAKPRPSSTKSSRARKPAISRSSRRRSSRPSSI